jgi:NAD(P)H-dependent flavin oxidoreductase YrpB (nitropropane dioxygenase family)
MSQKNGPVARAEAFAQRLGIRLPILLAPMSGACPPSLSIAVANAGGMGACGARLRRTRCTVACARSSAARPDTRNARRSIKGGRRRAYADLGGAGGQAGAQRTTGRRGPELWSWAEELLIA